MISIRPERQNQVISYSSYIEEAKRKSQCTNRNLVEKSVTAHYYLNLKYLNENWSKPGKFNILGINNYHANLIVNQFNCSTLWLTFIWVKLSHLSLFKLNILGINNYYNRTKIWNDILVFEEVVISVAFHTAAFSVDTCRVNVDTIKSCLEPRASPRLIQLART